MKTADPLQAAAIAAHQIVVSRTARFFTLGDTQNYSELWVVLHGYGMLAYDFLRWFSNAARPDRLIVAPEGLSRFYHDTPERPVGASWMTREDRDHEIVDQVNYLDSLVARLDPRGSRKLTVHGFSQGTATAVRWLINGRAPASRLVLWGGVTPPDTDLGDLARKLADHEVTLVFGTRDRYYDQTAVGTERERLEAHGIKTVVYSFDGGHRVDDAVLQRM